jgi:hypothetical protein
MSDLTSGPTVDIECPDCRIAIPKNSLFPNGLCQMCNSDLSRHLAVLERWEAERG